MMYRVKQRYLHLLVGDAAIVVCSLVLAWCIRTFVVDLDMRPAVTFGLISVACFLLVNYVFGLYHRIWRYASASEVLVIISSVVVSTGCLILVNIFWPAHRLVPLSIVPLMAFFAFFGFVVIRYRTRLWTGLRWRWLAVHGRFPMQRTRVLIVGAGEAGQLAAWRFLNMREGRAYKVVGFIDDDTRKHGLRIHGFPVLGNRQSIPEIAVSHKVDLILIAIYNIRHADFQETISLCETTTAVIKVLPNMFDMMSGAGKGVPLRDISVEDVLGRDSAQIDRVACQGLLGNKTVLVTGAAGSIGSELCRQVLTFGPRELLMLDNNESGLHDLFISLTASEGITEPDKSDADAVDETPAITPVIASVVNGRKMRSVFQRHRPQIVFHAAAYKHVPLMEQHPDEAVCTNVLGTRTVAELAANNGVERFVLISTDKAINPSSVMGATKRVCEMVIGCGLGDQQPAASPHDTTFTAVRFGNVLGSRGSVVPTFERQIDAGGPVTVTHPEMTRYLMSIPEAVSLVIQAASLTIGGDIFMLDMGQPVAIDELARRLIRFRGLRPEIDIPIVYTGVRPGEKMHEELLGPDELRLPSAHPSINRILGNTSPDTGILREQVEELIALAKEGQNERAIRLLWDIVGRAGLETHTPTLVNASAAATTPQRGFSK